MSRVLLVVLLATAPVFAGCADLGNLLGASCGNHQLKSLSETAWNREGQFRVVAPPGQEVRIEATGAAVPVSKVGFDDVTLDIPDGTWTITYQIGGATCGTFDGVRVDTTPPVIRDLVTAAHAPEGTFLLGEGAAISGHAGLRIVALRTGMEVSRTLPVPLSRLGDGLHPYLVSAWDEAGNYANATVQVQVGDAVDLPAGQYDFGVVARYSNTLRLWELTEPERYLSRAAARAESGAEFLGAGHGIDPDDAEVRRVVAAMVTPEMNTMQAALVLFEYMAENLEYDEQRLETDALLTPKQVLLDTEDPSGRDCPDPSNKDDPACDGLVASGAGNGVRGGICRDLAATYVSLLRAAGVPARLVSGYVGGTVNGFHAWVEFYGGSIVDSEGKAQAPWIPVDVSTIDGPYRPEVLVQSFGIERPEYLALRSVPASAEVAGWSTALSMSWTWPRGDGAPEPSLRFGKEVRTDYSGEGILCVHLETLARKVADNSSRCSRPTYTATFSGVIREATRTIDYGVQVDSAPRGTYVRAEVAYPFEGDVKPDQVIYRFYGPALTLDTAAGKAVSEFYPSGR